MVPTDVDVDALKRSGVMNVFVKSHMGQRDHDIGALTSKNTGFSGQHIFRFEHEDAH